MNSLTASSTVFSWQLPSGESTLPICRWMMGSVRDGAVSNRKQVMRLDNAINRGLEQPDSPEAVMALILQGAAARYACCPEPSAESEPSDSLTEADWRRFQRAVSHITISQDAEVTLIFTDKKATGKDE